MIDPELTEDNENPFIKLKKVNEFEILLKEKEKILQKICYSVSFKTEKITD